jgi:hypothetical protein
MSKYSVAKLFLNKIVSASIEYNPHLLGYGKLKRMNVKQQIV